MQWLNEPARWSAAGRTLTVTADAGTDFWRTTHYGFVRDTGHLYGEQLGGDFDLSVLVRGDYAAQYDQAGVMVRIDERRWLKTGIEPLTEALVAAQVWPSAANTRFQPLCRPRLHISHTRSA